MKKTLLLTCVPFGLLLSPDKSQSLEKGKQILKAATAAVVLLTWVQANDLIKECWSKYDYNKNWVIDKWWEEYVCKKAIKNKEWEIVLAKLDMTIDNLKKELKIVEEELRKDKDENKKLKEEREKKRQWLIEHIKSMQTKPWKAQ